MGGTDAAEGAWPWQVGIVYEEMILYCGGTIINANTIVTAAHCVEFMEPRSITVKVG